MKCISKNLITIILALGLCTSALAQMPAPEATPVPDAGLVPAGTEAAAPATGLTADEAEKEKPAEAAKETPQKALSLSPYLWFKPLNMDKDLGSQVASLGIEPGVDFSADFNTATKRTLGLSLGYLLVFRQYLDKGYDRYFEHDFSFGLSHDITPKFSMAAAGVFYVIHWYSAGQQGNNNIAYELVPGLTYKINDKLTAKLGYYGLFSYDPNVIRSYDQVDSITNPPSEAGDIMRGTAGVYDYYDPYGIQSNPYYPSFTPVVPAPGGEVNKLFLHTITLQLGYKFTPNTTGTLKYHYYGNVNANNDESEYTGHQIYLILGQKVWEGGNLSLEYRIRRRAFSYNFAEDGSNAIDYLHRIYFTLTQEINSYLSIEAYWNLQHSRSSKTGIANTHIGYLGAKFSF